MTWHAKPSGLYTYKGAEWTDNVLEMAAYFNGKGYSVEAQTGIIANAVAESGLNPWRWQSDKVNYSAGYGLFQFTPASDYFNKCTGLAYYAPNKSVTSVTEGAKPTDALAQMAAFDTNKLSKWGPGCWRPYWSTTTYASLYQERNRIVTKYGSNNQVSMEQFKKIDNVWDATFVFLAAFEGPLVPNMTARYNIAKDVYQVITGSPPGPGPDPGPGPGPGPGPDPQPPTPTKPRKMKLIYYLRRYN